jgi:tetratricopeptide (TPR) repeat protein
MKQVKLFISVVFLISFNFSFAQESVSDKLKEYETASLNKKMELFFYFFQKFESDQQDSVLYYVNDLLSEGIKNKNHDAIALANYGIGPYLLNHSLFEEAEAKLEKAKKHYHKVENDTMLADVYNCIGNSAFLQGKLAQAELLYNKSSEFAIASGEERFKMLSVFNLSRIYLNQGKVEEAKDMIQDYIDFNLANGAMRRLAAAYGLMGQLYLNQNDNKLAIDFFTRSMESGLTAGNMTAVANGYTNLAIAEYLSGEMQKSEQYFQLALAYRQKAGDKYFIVEGYYNLGDFYYAAAKFDSAIVNYAYSLKIAEEANNLKGQKEALMQLSYVYDTLDQKNNQIAVLIKVISTQEKLAKQQSYKEINALKLSHAQSEKEAINTGGIREDQLYGQVAEYQSIFSNWVWIVFTCMLVLLVFIYFFRRSSKK